MQFGIFSVSDVTRDPVSGVTPSEAERIRGIVAIARRAEEVGLDVFAIGDHHNPPFLSSSPSTLLAVVAATTEHLILSTSTTLITTNDPVRIAEEYAARKDPDTPDAPTHESRVQAKYGDGPARQPRPNANRGDNVTGGSPYQDSEGPSTWFPSLV